MILVTFRSTTKADPYTKMASMETFRELEKFPPDQQQQLITQVLKEALPAAKDDLFIDEIRPLLYQNGVITSEEATELLGIFTGEEKVTRLYTKMLPSKGVKGLKKFMKILHDTGWKTPSHMLHHSVLSKILAVCKLYWILLLYYYYLRRRSFYRSRVTKQYFISTKIEELQGKPLYPLSTQSHSQMLWSTLVRVLTSYCC